MLRLDGVDAAYGMAAVLHGVTIEVPPRNIVAVLGANGAGKTTALRVISGLLPPRSGTVELNGERINRLSAEQIVARGVIHVPQGRHLFPDMTVAENLRLGAYARRDRRAIKGDLDRVFGYFPVLGQRLKQVASTLSGGEQQMLAIARALMGKPRFLLLDEPSLGLAPLVTREIFRIIHAISETDGVSVLLVEQNANLALGIAHRGYVMETGRVILHGSAATLRDDDAVRKSYLGQ